MASSRSSAHDARLARRARPTRGGRIAMALSRQSLSPTATLLRTSRLFSLPKPLPTPPVGEHFGSGTTRASDSATLPFPTHQAIATTKSSLARGDWGLKRPLPRRSRLLQVSDPVLRVTQLDTIEHVTDFDSAADHVRTRQKFEEMAVPMMKGMALMRTMDGSRVPPTGAFERRDDTTSYDCDLGLDESGLFLKALKQNVHLGGYRALDDQTRSQAKAAKAQLHASWQEQWQAMVAAWDAEGVAAAERHAQAKAHRRQHRKARRDLDKQLAGLRTTFTPFTPPPVDPDVHNAKRWKHDGPWLPGMGDEDFVKYLRKEIAHRKAEFNAYLVEFVKNEIYTTRCHAAFKDGEVPPMDMAEAEAWQAEREQKWRLITDAEVAAGIKTLRKDTANNPLHSRLITKLILPFLRLPAIKFKSTSYAQDATSRDIDRFQFDQESTPLSTHPSAGLGYLRTKSYLTNHPILGPQASHAPIPARVVQARVTSTSKESFARLGVGGFITNDSVRGIDATSAIRTSLNNTRDVETIDIDTPGGKKLGVKVLYGAVATDGRIHIKAKRATGPEVAVARGELEDKPPEREHVMDDLLVDLAGGQVTGVKELDEESVKAKQLTGFLASAQL